MNAPAGLELEVEEIIKLLGKFKDRKASDVMFTGYDDNPKMSQIYGLGLGKYIWADPANRKEGHTAISFEVALPPEWRGCLP